MRTVLWVGIINNVNLKLFTPAKMQEAVCEKLSTSMIQ